MRALIHPGNCGDTLMVDYRLNVLTWFDRFATGQLSLKRQAKRRQAKWTPARLARHRKALALAGKKRKPKVTDVQIAAANEAAQSGMHWSALARRYGVCESTLMRYCKRAKPTERAG